MGEKLTPFSDRLSALVAQEATASHGDAERFGVMIERLAAALGFTVAMAARGDGNAIDTMLTGAEGYAHEEAVSKAPFVRFMSELKRAAR